MVFGRIDATSPEAAAKLPLVDDQRAAAATIAVGDTLDPVILDAARRLGSLRPADLGTAASRLDIQLDDAQGFSLNADPVGWSAVFGFYTPTLRTTDLIPGQVPVFQLRCRPRGRRAAGDPRRRPQRHLRAAGGAAAGTEAGEDAQAHQVTRAVTAVAGVSADPGVW
jgi:hypothetical protein